MVWVRLDVYVSQCVCVCVCVCVTDQTLLKPSKTETASVQENKSKHFVALLKATYAENSLIVSTVALMWPSRLTGRQKPIIYLSIVLPICKSVHFEPLVCFDLMRTKVPGSRSHAAGSTQPASLVFVGDQTEKLRLQSVSIWMASLRLSTTCSAFAK